MADKCSARLLQCENKSSYKWTLYRMTENLD
jgi:hypothetical protein